LPSDSPLYLVSVRIVRDKLGDDENFVRILEVRIQES
jgi:hypothetical protein